MKKANKKTILRGEGSNQHTIYGDFKVKNETDDFTIISVLKDAELRHEEPNGEFAEHNTLKVDKGVWVMGRQVEFNPFKRTISQVWD